MGTGDEVLMPTITFASAAAVVIHLGARPVLVDCLPDTLSIDPADLERRITARSKAIVPMHHGGHPCQMDRIIEIARKRRLPIVEDAATPCRLGTAGEVSERSGMPPAFRFTPIRQSLLARAG